MWQGHANFGTHHPIAGCCNPNNVNHMLCQDCPVRKAQIQRKRKVKKVAQFPMALWCKVGQHPFDPDDPDKQMFTQTRTIPTRVGNSYGSDVMQNREEVTETIGMCGPCYRKQNPFQPHEDTPKEIDHYDPEYTASLEKDLGYEPENGGRDTGHHSR